MLLDSHLSLFYTSANLTSELPPKWIAKGTVRWHCMECDVHKPVSPISTGVWIVTQHRALRAGLESERSRH
jgi:hypothetical protein